MALAIVRPMGQRGLFAVSGMLSADMSTPPGTWLLQWHLTAHCVSRLHPQSSPTPSIAVHGYTSSAVNSDRCGCRHKDCRAPFHYGNKLFILAVTTLYPDTAPSSRCRARLHIGMSGNLRLLFRVVDAGLLHSLLQSHGLHTQATFLPPIEVAADFIPSLRH